MNGDLYLWVEFHLVIVVGHWPASETFLGEGCSMKLLRKLNAKAAWGEPPVQRIN